jgi:hypothetical protein
VASLGHPFLDAVAALAERHLAERLTPEALDAVADEIMAAVRAEPDADRAMAYAVRALLIVARARQAGWHHPPCRN